MNLMEILESLRVQGPVLWAAAAAMALGASLLVVAAWVQLRRFRGARPAPAERPPTVSVTANGYVATPAAVSPVPAPLAAAAPDPRLVAAGQRLSAAADRLEALRAALEQGSSAGSGLKETPSSVEYVFRSGTA